MRSFAAPDGATWNVAVKLPSHSSALVVFQHAAGQWQSGDRYAWLNVHSTRVSDPRERLSARELLDGLSDAEIVALFRRSMAVSGAGDGRR